MFKQGCLFQQVLQQNVSTTSSEYYEEKRNISIKHCSVKT